MGDCGVVGGVRGSCTWVYAGRSGFVGVSGICDVGGDVDDFVGAEIFEVGDDVGVEESALLFDGAVFVEV